MLTERPLKEKHASVIREGILAGRTQAELARELNVSEGTVGEVAPRVSSMSPQDRIKYRLNRLIRRKQLGKTVEEIEGILHATIEDYVTVRARAVGISWDEMRQLLRNLPEFKLSRRQILQRELRRLHENGEPLYNTSYVHAVHGNLYERARQQFGNYWTALRSIGVRARPIMRGNAPRLREVAVPLTPLQEELLRLRLAGASYPRIARSHSLTLSKVYAHFDRITDKIDVNTNLRRKLRTLDKDEEQLRAMEQHEPPSREDVLDAFIQGKPVYRITRETGLTQNGVLAHMFSFSRLERQRSLDAARSREKAVLAFEKGIASKRKIVRAAG